MSNADLSHAGTCTFRIARHLARMAAPEPVLAPVRDLVALLAEFHENEELPPDEQARVVVSDAAIKGRELVAALEGAGLKDDRLGQSVRNLFECLDLAEEGAELSLRVGEDPRSLMRP
jgi:hypothetical protein